MTEVQLVLLVLTLLFIKHFVADFLLQSNYMVAEKGIYGAMGGIHHSAIHAVGTFFVMLFFHPIVAISAAIADFVIHYHIDWAKMNINKKLGLTVQDYGFWAWLGADQLAHCLTYIAIVGWATRAF